jgi:hypothetical protein
MSRLARAASAGSPQAECRTSHALKIAATIQPVQEVSTCAGQRSGGDGGESNSPSRNLLRRPLRACSMICRRSPGRPSTACRALQSRPLSGFDSGYATLLGIAPPLNDASTAHGGEAASTFTLLPKQRGRKQTGCCQLLRLGSFLRGLETNLGSRSPATGPCRNHASPQVLLLPAPADCTAGAVAVNPGLRSASRCPCSGARRACFRRRSRRWPRHPTLGSCARSRTPCRRHGPVLHPTPRSASPATPAPAQPRP